MKHFNSLDGNLNHRGFHFINGTVVFILLFFKLEFLPSLLSISAKVKVQDKGFNKLVPEFVIDSIAVGTS